MANLAQAWEEDSLKHPGQTKDTFVRNYLFSKHGLDDLIAFLKAEEELHGQVFESTAICSPESISTPDPDREGWQRWRMDLSRPHVVLRIQIEVVTDGQGHIRNPPLLRDWSCDD